MAAILEQTNKYADADCAVCNGTGYARAETFDPLDGSVYEATDICDCVLKALGADE